jgi:D-amino-acid dehydrogenase
MTSKRKGGPTTSVVVIGGGVVGLACAYYLNKAGAEVTVLERAKVGSGSSPGASGIVAPEHATPLPGPGQRMVGVRSFFDRDSPLYIRPLSLPALVPWLTRFWIHSNARHQARGREALVGLTRRTLALFDGMLEDGVDFEMFSLGVLWASQSTAAAQKALDALRPMEQFGYSIPSRLITGDELQEVEPALSDRVKGGFLVESDRYLRPERFTDALAAAVAKRGVEVVEGGDVVEIVASGSAVTAVRTARATFTADHYLLAAGAWTKGLARMLGIHLPIEPGKGYSFSIVPPSMPRRPVWVAEGLLMTVPRGDHVRVASTMEFSGLNMRLDQRRVATIHRTLEPCFRGWDVSTMTNLWTGMRPMTPDGLPVIGRLEPFTNTYVASGHGMGGVSEAPATGEAIARAIVEGVIPDVLVPFRPNRFHAPWLG